MPTTIGGTTGVDKVKDINAVSFLPFTKEYVSPQQTMTPGGLISLSHGLGATPKLVTYEYVCVTAADGYSVGDVVEVAYSDYSTTVTSNLQLGLFNTKNNTTLSIRIGANGPPVMAIKSTGATANTASTTTNFRLVVRAYA